MKRFFGYIRVSTVKQGEGVSLAEQRAAIERYAAQHGLDIAEWFEDQETAAKRGRREFGRMLKALARGRADGVVIHKIDRSARNLKDWADLGELIDTGVTVHFANEGLDLASRGGRLSADIQAVVAADYVRNLREETLKGFYGRLKQGIWPLQAPLGYLDRGAGNPKTIDPVRGPLVRQAFELYATGRYTLRTLLVNVHGSGLRNRRGGRVSLNALHKMLRNPFYVGLLRIAKTGETFAGAHEPLVSTAVFKRVGEVLSGKTASRPVRHDFLFRKTVACVSCGWRLIGERQKGLVYYRCHTERCRGVCVREEALQEVITAAFATVSFNDTEREHLRREMRSFTHAWSRRAEEARAAARLRLGQVKAKLTRLTDAYLDGVLERDLFEEQKAALLLRRREAEESVAASQEGPETHLERLRSVVELASSLPGAYDAAAPERKRELLRIATSNLAIRGKKVEITLAQPFRLIAERSSVPSGGLAREIARSGRSLTEKTESEVHHGVIILRKLLTDLLSFLETHPRFLQPTD